MRLPIKRPSNPRAPRNKVPGPRLPRFSLRPLRRRLRLLRRVLRFGLRKAMRMEARG